MKAIKRFLLILFGVLMALPALSVDFTSGSLTYTVLSESAKTCAVTGATSKTITTVTIPLQANGYNVTQVAQEAFKDYTSLQSAIIGPNISVINASAFAGCTSLKTVYIGPNVSSIGDSAFASDINLTDIYSMRSTAPTLQSNSFPSIASFKSMPTLHIQSNRISNYASGAWANFTQTAALPTPTEISTYNIASRTSGNAVKTTYDASDQASPSSYDIYLQNGLSMRFYTTLSFNSTLTGTDTALSTLFWYSDSEDVTVSSNGTIACKAAITSPVTVYVRSMMSGGNFRINLIVNPAFQSSDGSSQLYYTILDNSSCAVVNADKAITATTVPSTVTINNKKYTVTTIGAGAFFQCYNLTSLTLPNTVTTLEYRALAYTGLTSMTLPASVTTLNGDTFKFSKSLERVIIPNSVSDLGTYCFDGCEALKNVTLSNNLTSIRTCTFQDCSALASITVPQSVTSIGTYAFKGCSALKSVVLPPDVTTIGTYAFSECTELESIYMGANYTSIGNYAFDGDSKLKDIYITDQTAPTISANTFPAALYSSATLHLQGNGDYATKSYWKNFVTNNKVVLMPVPKDLRTYNLATIPGSDPLKVTPDATQPATTSYAIYNGGSITYTTTLNYATAPTGLDAVMNKLYWYIDSDKITVSSNGTLKCTEDLDQPVNVTIKSLYGKENFKIQITINPSLASSSGSSQLYYTIIDDKTCALTSADKSITDANIPANVTLKGKQYAVTGIGEGSFYNCTKMTKVTIPSAVTTIGYRAFYNAGLTSVTIPSSVEIINSDSFKFCRSLETVVIPNSVTNLGTYCFDGCTALKNVTLGNGINSIKSYTFQDCSALASITVPQSVTSIGTYAFKGCSALTSIVLPPDVTTIGTYAFSGCTELASIYMGANYTSIGDYAFDGDSKLKDIYITDQTAPTISANTFPAALYSSATLHLQSNGDYDSKNYWKNFVTNNKVVLMPVPTDLRTYNVANIPVASPLKVTPEAEDKATTSYSLRNGGTITYTTTLNYETEPVGIDAPMNRLYWYIDSDKVTVSSGGKLQCIAELDKPVTVTVKSLYGNENFKIQITLTASLIDANGNPMLSYTILDDKTCALTSADKAITEALIPKSVVLNGKEYTVREIGEGAFLNCTNLTTLSVPNTVTTLRYRSFYNTGLTSVTLPSSVTDLTGDVFKFSRKLHTIVIPNSVTNIGTYTFDGCEALANVTLSKSITSIKGYTFQDCSSLESIEIPQSVTSIGTYAFKGCSALTSIVLPPDVTTIGTYAFSGCTELASIYMGANYTSIGNYAFDGDSKLKDIYITDQTAPIISSNTFPADLYSSATLHLQGEGDYATKNYWKNFFTNNKVVAMPVPTDMRTWNIATIPASSPLKVTPEANVPATTSYALKPGGSITYTTILNYESVPTDIDEPMNRLYWYIDSDKLSLSSNGTLTGSDDLDMPVTVTVKSLYARENFKIQITVNPSLANTEDNQLLYYTILNDKYCALSSADGAITEAQIPETVVLNGAEYTVKEIGEGAFYNCTNLASVSIPNSVTTLRYRCFYNTGLTKVVLPESVVNLTGDAFKFSRKLETVVIPNSVTNLGSYSFDGCTALRNVFLGSGIKQINGYTFQDCKALATIVLPPLVTSVGEKAFSGCTGLKKVYLGCNVKTISKEAFAGTALTDIYITSQTAPAIDEKRFPAYTATLHLQGTSAQNAFKSGLWNNFKTTALRKCHTGMTLSIPSPTAASSRMKKTSAMDSPEHIYGLSGETHQRTASLEWNNDEADEHKINSIYWTSDDTSKVYVDHNGTITLNQTPELRKPVTVTAQSLYANAPTQTVTIDNQLMTDIEEISLDSENADMSHGRIFTTDGIYVGESVNMLTPGVYILRQGKKAYKIYVK